MVGKRGHTAEQNGGPSSQLGQKDVFLAPTGSSGTLYNNVPASVLIPGGSAKELYDVVVKHNSRKLLWTRPLSSKTGIFSPWPAIEGIQDSLGSLIDRELPLRSGSGPNALPRKGSQRVDLVIKNLEIPENKVGCRIELLEKLIPTKSKSRTAKKRKIWPPRKNWIDVPGGGGESFHSQLIEATQSRMQNAMEALSNRGKSDMYGVSQHRNEVLRYENEEELPDAHEYISNISGEVLPHFNEQLQRLGLDLLRKALDLNGTDGHRVLDYIASVHERPVESGGLAATHVMGCALEWVALCYFSSRTSYVLRDYTAASQSGPVFLDCKVVTVWGSALPENHTFSIKRKVADLKKALIQQHGVKKGSLLADRIVEYVRRDIYGFDFIVWLQEEQNTNKNHFLLGQCKAVGSQRANAFVNILTYVGYASILEDYRDDIGCSGTLMPLVWLSNVTRHRQVERILQKSILRRKILPLLQRDEGDEMCSSSFMLAVKSTVDRLQEWNSCLSAPQNIELELPNLRNLQENVISACEVWLGQYPEGERSSFTVAMFPGAGKTRVAKEVCNLVESSAHSFYRACNELAMAHFSLGINLTLQNCKRFMEMDQAMNSGLMSRPICYVVCSADQGRFYGENIRIITAEEVTDVLRMHDKKGELHKVCFFSTIEGGGSFWYYSNLFQVTSSAWRDKPFLFGNVVKDECHKASSINTDIYTFCNNLSCIITHSYTATPRAEVRRREKILNILKKRCRKDEPRICERLEGLPQRTARVVEVDTEDRVSVDETDDECESVSNEDFFPQDHYLNIDGSYVDEIEDGIDETGTERQENEQDDEPRLCDDPGLEGAIQQIGLHGIQLLDRLLLFETFDKSNAKHRAIIDVLPNEIDKPSQKLFSDLEKRLKKPLAVYEVVSLVKYGASDHLNDFLVVWDGRKANVAQIYFPDRTLYPRVSQADCIVLGVFASSESSSTEQTRWRYCIRKGNNIIGAAIHDTTPYSPLTNRIGCIPDDAHVSAYQCFADGVLAPFKVAFHLMDPIQVHQKYGESSAQRLLGCQIGEEGDILVRHPGKVWYNIHDSSSPGSTLVSSRLEVEVAFAILNVMKPSDSNDTPVKHHLQFAPNNASARRITRLLNLMISKSNENHLRGVVARHVFQSETLPTRDVEYMSINEREYHVQEFVRAKRGILVTYRAIGPGIDIPCIDGVGFTIAPTNSEDFIQLAGRAFRIDPSNPSKVATILLMCPDPASFDQEQLDEMDQLKVGNPEPFYMEFELAKRIVQCMGDPSLRVALGKVFSVVHNASSFCQGSSKKQHQPLQSLMISHGGSQEVESTHITTEDLSLLHQLSSVVRCDPFKQKPKRIAQVPMLHKYAEQHEGKFPKKGAQHPDHPEWRWGNWVCTLCRDYLKNLLAADVKEAMDQSPHWSSLIKTLQQKQEARRNQEPIPSRLEQVQLLHQHAQDHGGEFPAQSALHPIHPEWRWGQWGDALSQAYLKGKLAHNVRAAMDGSRHWRSRIEFLQNIQEEKSKQVPNPTCLERVILLHEYAEKHGKFPARGDHHPDHSEWNWGNWRATLPQDYLNNKLDSDVMAAMEQSSHWKETIESIRQGREEKGKQRPTPSRLEQVNMLHEYADSNQGKFPVFTALHPKHPEWKWGNWAGNIFQAYSKDRLNNDETYAMENSSYWMAHWESRRRKREMKEKKEPNPSRLKQVEMLHRYAEENRGNFPTISSWHPVHADWNWGKWVNMLSQAYMANKLLPDVKNAMDQSPHWMEKIESLRRRRAQGEDRET